MSPAHRATLSHPHACPQEVGKQNLFVFGVDADDVPRLREERKNFKDYDPRWTAVMKSLLSGTFGDKAFFQVLQSYRGSDACLPYRTEAMCAVRCGMPDR